MNAFSASTNKRLRLTGIVPSKFSCVHFSRNKSVFGIVDLMWCIASYLDIFQIVVIRRLNKHFNNQLSFKFYCINGNVYFKRVNYAIDKIISHQICHYLTSLVMWYYQCLNNVLRTNVFKTLCNKDQNCINFDNSNSKQTKFLFSLRMDLSTVDITEFDELIAKCCPHNRQTNSGDCMLRIKICL